MNFIIDMCYLFIFICLLNLIVTSNGLKGSKLNSIEKSSSLSEKRKNTAVSITSTPKLRRFFNLLSNKHASAKFTTRLEKKEKGEENDEKIEKSGFSIQYSSQTPTTTKKMFCKSSNRKQSIDSNSENKNKSDDSLHKQEISATHPNYHIYKKRNVQNPETFTAKNVAALEVIVDLMKNTASLEDVASELPNNLILGHPVKSVQQLQDTTNSIQVHIAIPYDIQQGKKRSALEPMRVRKVFSARMSTPVDLEYQIHSFEGSPETTTTAPDTDDGLSPGMYFLVDKANNGYALKPVKAKIDLSDLRPREVVTAPLVIHNDETTRRDDVKNMAKVTLSKNFIAAVNKQLVELYENLTKPQNDDTHSKRKRRMNPTTVSYFQRKPRRKKYTPDILNHSHYRVRRFIDWNAVRNYVGSDRVCNCKCKPYKPMCRACAASDAVINELIFEFDNIEQYMKDHCTEIQTYFWMNPSGGLQLRDTVHSIDKSLNDYYKRVKGKCQGKTCKTFGANLDKKRFIKSAIVKDENNVKQVIDELASIADDLNRTVKISTCFNRKLNEEGYKMLQAINNCVSLKKFEKRSDAFTTVKKLVKNVYSLDNINVNIICKSDIQTTETLMQASVVNNTSTTAPSTSSSTTSIISTTTTTPITSTNTTIPTDGQIITNQKPQDQESLFEFDFEDDHEKPKKRKGFKYLFPRRNKKDKLFTYFTKQHYITSKPLIKRDTYSQIEIPLISDSGGTFWFDYLQATSTDESRIARHTKLQIANPKLGIAVVQSKFVTSKQNETKDDATMNFKMKHSEGTTPNATEYKKQTSKAKEDMNIVLNIDADTLKHTQRETDPEIVSEYLADDISQLLQLFGSKKDVEAMDMLSNKSQFLQSTSKQIVKTKTTKSNSKTADLKNKRINTNVYTNSERKTTIENSSLNRPNKYWKHSKTMILKSETTKTPPLSLQSLEKKGSVVYSSKITGCTNESILTTKKHRTTKYKSFIPKKNKTNTQRSSMITSKVTKVSTSSPYTNSSIKINTDTASTISPLLTEKKDETSTSILLNESLESESIAMPITDLNTENTQRTCRTTRKPGFFGKIRTATLRFLGFTKFVGTEVTTRTVQRSHPITTLIDKISNTEIKLIKLDDLTDGTTAQNLINEHDDKINGDESNRRAKNSDENKKLLMSIIQYEANKLNEEWQRIAHSSEKDSDHGYKNMNNIRSTDNDQAALTDLFKEIDYKKPLVDKDIKVDIMQDLKNIAEMPELQIPDPAYKHKCEFKTCRKKTTGFLNMIVSKIGMKIVPDKKKVEKAVKQCHPGEVVRNFRTTRAMNVDQNTNITEASETFQSSNIVCDLRSTYNHILFLYIKLDKNKFETFVEDIPCCKYKRLSRSFFINYKTLLKWNWIRNKRSLMRRPKGKADTIHSSNRYESGRYFDLFESFVRDEDGIYRVLSRRKRDAHRRPSAGRLKRLPALPLTMNEVYSMVGDSVTLNCLFHHQFRTAYPESKCTWDAEREDMLKHDNVQVDGTNLLISQVGPKNSGRYRCSVDNVVRRDVQLYVVTLPSIDVMFVPTYGLPRECAYEDLKAIQKLSEDMSSQIPCGKVCSIRIDEPVCQRDLATNRSLVRPTVVLTVSPVRVKCSVQCRRDLHNSLVRLCVSNVPALRHTTVVICRDGLNETLIPSKEADNSVITHKLRKKDSNGHREYHKLSSLTDSDGMDVIIGCAAGYYLMREQGLCAACPSNTRSSAGDNRCTPCPAGTRSNPGAPECHSSPKRHRRYDWWWYPPCGYLVACTTVVCACGICVAFSLLVHLVSRRIEPREAKKPATPVYGHIRSTRTRPLSPSRVILARFFKASLTSSRATPVDSQETRFELWKERNIPPPLPPVDFDLDTG